MKSCGSKPREEQGLRAWPGPRTHVSMLTSFSALVFQHSVMLAYISSAPGYCTPLTTKPVSSQLRGRAAQRQCQRFTVLS